jgi:hypothetical protein
MSVVVGSVLGLWPGVCGCRWLSRILQALVTVGKRLSVLVRRDLAMQESREV